MEYSGNVLICGKKYMFQIKDFEFILLNSRTEIIVHKEIEKVNNTWIKAETKYNKLDINISLKRIEDENLIFKIIAMKSLLKNFSDDSKKIEDVHKLTYRNNVLDFFYRPKENYSEMVSSLIKSFGNNKCEIPSNTETYNIEYKDKKFKLYFGMNCYLKVEKPFMFDTFSSLNIECDENITDDEILEISMIVKKFLSFLSNSRFSYIEKIIINDFFVSSQTYSHGEFVLLQTEKRQPNFWHTLIYDDLKSNISEIFEEIIDDKICFSSLFQYDEDFISSIDIMNICASFEKQFEVTYPNYKDDNFNLIKKEILKLVKENETTIVKNDNLKDYFDDIYNWIKVYKSNLKSKLEYALEDFEQLYIEENNKERILDMKFDFGKEYKGMPSIMKEARNNLDHGNSYELKVVNLTDTLLLRAIVYNMILKCAKVDNKNDSINFL